MPHLATDTFDLKPVFFFDYLACMVAFPNIQYLYRKLCLLGILICMVILLQPLVYILLDTLRSKRCELLCDHTIGVIKGSY